MSLIDSNAIRNHPSNNSPSKNAFQFSKSKRFPDYNPEYALFYADANWHFILTIASSPIAKHHSVMGRK